MRHLFLTVTAVTTLGFSSPATAQGVPTFDGSQLGQLVAQLEHMAEDLNVQMQQLATMRLELETQLSQLTNLEAQLTSLIEGSGLGELFATVEEFRALRGKLVAPLNTAQSLASGDFLSGFNPGAELSASVERVLSGSGFTSERLSTLSGSDQPADNRIAAPHWPPALSPLQAQESPQEAGHTPHQTQHPAAHPPGPAPGGDDRPPAPHPDDAARIPGQTGGNRR